ncbi:hypothetical protein JQC92_02025 [Shewanella sp. 202IG2-18]|uniref:hypothetical protein n=1 Tax=Parashewanella hymeniacidonis TaxID=2807618 RepID=UPI001960E9E6|nr:hypothetical protein [Parashewanella hymeniacidonis]MBM7070818.1 hypothetical protein [Parashewanella hymeniacidonis]
MAFKLRAIQGVATSHSRSYGEELQRSRALKLGVRKSKKTYGQLLNHNENERIILTSITTA